MSLFAFSLLLGALLAGMDIARPDLRRSIRKWSRDLWLGIICCTLFIVIILAGVYIVLYLDYYRMAAPSTGFRFFTLCKRVIEHLPLTLAGAAVSFYAMHWLRQSASPRAQNVIPRGVGIAGAGLLVLGLFLLEDWRGLSVVQKLETPAFTVEFSRSRETVQSKPYLSEQRTTAPNFESAPIEQSLYILSLLGEIIDRDKKYIERFAAVPELAEISAFLDLEKSFYANRVVPVAKCLISIRDRVRDVDPLIVMDPEITRTLRELHRLNLATEESSSETDRINKRLNDIIGDFEGRRQAGTAPFNPLIETRMEKLLAIKDYRFNQHLAIKPPYRVSNEDLEDCRNIDEQFVKKVYHDDTLAFSPSTPYFTLATAAMLNAMNERLAAVEEIDAWLKYHDDQQRRKPAPSSREFMIDRVFKQRMEFSAGFFLLGEPKYASFGLRRLRRAVEAADEIFRNSSPGKWTLPLGRLFAEVDTRHPTTFCQNLDPDVQRILLSTIMMVNTIVAHAVVDDLLVLRTDYSDYVEKYHDVLAFVDPHCFRQVLTAPDLTLNTMSELTDTYFAAKRVRFQELSEERVAFELCRMKKPLRNADAYIGELEQSGSDKLTSNDFVGAEPLFDTARRLKRSVTAFNQALTKVGARACLVEAAKSTADKE